MSGNSKDVTKFICDCLLFGKQCFVLKGDEGNPASLQWLKNYESYILEALRKLRCFKEFL